ncbi:hypothetical protein DOTSEDRAFT_75393 [Dothistroma septosporum NZE10]|uniref:GrpB domain protein n=1 Tax=Dothistroma septosporum (strain NZE10 / CBS 128990) TaxID=675120 RepID=M2YLJ2_DOTSN|nr:hypothetical protein DOTSEDRAFT_75393 [Dothistroma septosporum NZE10]
MSQTDRTVNGIPIEDILKPTENQPDLVERVATRNVKAPVLAILPPDPQWFSHFETFKARIETALHTSSAALSPISIIAINHVGSTSVPGLPAKAVIDIDLVLSDNTLSAEPYYVPQLEDSGFQFLLREPAWHEHRFFAAHEPMSCNLHVWGPRCPEVERHEIFREWLKEHEEDRELYASMKTECAAASRERSETSDQYNVRKQRVLREILERAFRGLGYM